MYLKVQMRAEEGKPISAWAVENESRKEGGISIGWDVGEC